MKRKEHLNGQKHCAKCDRWLDLCSFHNNRRNWDGLHAYCARCMAASSRVRYERERERLLEQGRAYRAANPLKRKDAALRAKFGISLGEFEARKAEQGGVCAICGLPGRLNVDHCHASGTIRGLLCMPCNTAIGALGDDPERIRAAASYLEAAR